MVNGGDRENVEIENNLCTHTYMREYGCRKEGLVVGFLVVVILILIYPFQEGKEARGTRPFRRLRQFHAE